jgi:L-lactate dehydrogenase complex protein LldF
MALAPAAQFKTDATRVAADDDHREKIRRSQQNFQRARELRKALFQDWEGARSTAQSIKAEALEHLDKHLIHFEEQLISRGVKVYWADDAKDARDYVLRLAQEKRAQTIIKSKTMVSEEIHLNPELERAGYRVIESDLGEFIVQLRQEAPYHIVVPAMHLTRGEIGELFQNKLGSEPTTDPEELTMIARKSLRQEYCRADIGITGANFAVAETGSIAITENEGNARLTFSLPRVHVVLVGIEKVLPRLADLALFWPMLATSGTGQHITCYNSLVSGPRQPGELDGPEEMHVILLDNARTRLLADAEQRDTLQCIRCGACLNVCPIFRNVGGHTYGTTYQGPIGSVLTPHLRGLSGWQHLSQASSLCGACTEICPVKIDLHHHLLHNRRNAVEAAKNPSAHFPMQIFAFVMNRPWLFRALTRFARLLQPLHRPIQASDIDPLAAWTKSRDLPPIATKSFREWWEERCNGKS